MVQRRAVRYVQNNYHNTSSVTSMIDTLGWPTCFGLTSAWYARDFTSGFDICKFLFKYPRDLFPFEVILSMWVFHLRFDCSVTPRYFAEVTGSRNTIRHLGI
jgi:hypothetical protein